MQASAESEIEGMVQRPKAALRIAIAGLGAIGLKVAEALDQGIPGCVLAAVSANDRKKAAERLSRGVDHRPAVGAEVPVEASA